MTTDTAAYGEAATRRALFLALALSALVFSWAHGQAFRSPFVINDDARQQVAWMQGWHDPALYPDDLLTDFARHYVSYGVRGLYAVATTVVEPLVFSKILTGALYIALAGLVFCIGNRLAGWPGAWGMLCMYWIIPFFLHNISGGLARAFAGPLLALLCLGWMSGRAWMMAIALALQALCIPYMFVLCGLAVGLAWLAGVAARWGGLSAVVFPSRRWHWALLVAGAALVWQFNHSLDVAGYGPLVHRADMIDRPEFTAQGRLHIMPVPSILGEAILGPVERLLPTAELGAAGGAVVTVLLGVALAWGGMSAPWRRLRPHLRLLGSVLLASLLLYGVARLLLMQLFVPTRYLEYSVALGHCLVLGVCLAPWLSRRRLAPVLIGCFALAGAARLEGQGLYDYSRDTALYAAVEGLPKDVMVAGHPFLMDNVLTFGKRKVLVAFELAHPWCVGLWDRLEPRLDAFFAAYYASDAETVRAFAQRFDVDWMVVDTRHYEADFMRWPVHQVPVCQAGRFGPLQGLCEAVTNATTPVRDPLPDVYPVAPPFFAPYDARIRTQAARAGRFALLDETRFPGIRVDEHIRLVPLHRGEAASVRAF
ncbi:hypothetical protein [Megalodesulfovibrio gigas]|uniref:Uncharacterized protein n=1 Tax=Megalodesulfovibrio gigas (strain ATCC 19364 / DSM 1382 / NCIMB 9332 / VKM B-1759) TaxID=1121448 RepID=T2GG23_MEGG1|nr:hypothetical protein [Megalodesulfovibrio gigas]AGW15111.1 hypothetical protein DGI_3431 [Megalodesulfovibrio gigas DSM 1382 = ATCC 19364]